MRKFLTYHPILALIIAGSFCAEAQTPPFNQCPAVGLDTSCRILILIDATGSLRVLTDPNASPTYDGADDTLVGVLNLSSNAISGIPLHGPNQIFGFDGDGVCVVTPHPSGCPFGPTRYEGGGAGLPSVSFTNISSDSTAGFVNFNPPIQPNGGYAWFGLENAIQTQCAPINSPAPLKQGDSRWAGTFLGNTKITIGDYGCALTDLAMEINYYAQKQGKAFRTDPALLNAWLTSQNGFDSTGAIPLSKVPLVTTYAKNNGVTMYFAGLADHRDDFTLDQYLCNGYPPMLYVGNPHWVFATGQAVHNGNRTYSDIDPDTWPNGGTLDNVDWNNTYNSMLLFSDIVGPIQGLYVTAHSPIELLLTAPDGAQTGFNPLSNTRYNSIPSSGYVVTQLANDTLHGPPLTDPLKELAVVGSVSGSYQLQVFGTGNGPYTIDVTSYDVKGTPQTVTIAGTATPGATTLYEISNSTAPGDRLVVGAQGAVKLWANTIIGLGQSASLPFTLSAPAPDGGVTVTLASSDPSKVTVTPTVFVPAGRVSPNVEPQITGADFGAVGITASASGYSSTTEQATVIGALSFPVSRTAIIAPETRNLTLALSGPAPTAGLTVSLNSDDPAVAIVQATVSFAAGATSLSVPVTGVSGGTATIRAGAPLIPYLASALTSVVVVSTGTIIWPQSATVPAGSSLQLPIALSAPAPKGGVTITLASNLASVATISPASVFIAGGATTPASPPQVVGVNAGSAILTASAPGFSSSAVYITVK